MKWRLKVMMLMVGTPPGYNALDSNTPLPLIASWWCQWYGLNNVVWVHKNKCCFWVLMIVLLDRAMFCFHCNVMSAVGMEAAITMHQLMKRMSAPVFTLWYLFGWISSMKAQATLNSAYGPILMALVIWTQSTRFKCLLIKRAWIQYSIFNDFIRCK